MGVLWCLCVCFRIPGGAHVLEVITGNRTPQLQCLQIGKLGRASGFMTLRPHLDSQL